MLSSISFVAPHGRVRDLARVIVGGKGVVHGVHPDWSDDVLEVEQFIRLAADEVIEVEFNEVNESNPIVDLASLLDEKAVVYLGMWQQHADSASQNHFDAGYIIRLDPATRGQCKSVDAGCDEFANDLRLGGFTEDKIDQMIALYAPQDEPMPTQNFMF